MAISQRVAGLILRNFITFPSPSSLFPFLPSRPLHPLRSRPLKSS